MNTPHSGLESDTKAAGGAPASSGGAGKKLFVFAVVALIAGVAYTKFGDALSLENLARQETELREYQAAQPVVVFGAAFAIYVLVTGLSLPGAAVLTLVFGWYFGFLPALVLVSFASTAGATLAFLLSRFLFRDTIQKRFGEKLVNFNESLEKEGPFFLFTLRLIPAVPFFVINAVMGLTPISARTFWWISQVGMLPGTAVYVYAGSSVPDLQTLANKGIGAVFTPGQMAQIITAFVLLGMFPLIVRFVMKRLTSANEPQSDADSSHDMSEDSTNSPYTSPSSG